MAILGASPSRRRSPGTSASSVCVKLRPRLCVSGKPIAQVGAKSPSWQRAARSTDCRPASVTRPLMTRPSCLRRSGCLGRGPIGESTTVALTWEWVPSAHVGTPLKSLRASAQVHDFPVALSQGWPSPGRFPGGRCTTRLTVRDPGECDQCLMAARARCERPGLLPALDRGVAGVSRSRFPSGSVGDTSLALPYLGPTQRRPRLTRRFTRLPRRRRVPGRGVWRTTRPRRRAERA